jgi:DNA repair protein radc
MHEGHRERLRKRFKEGGLDAFADHEALELLLSFAIPRKDVNPLAHSLIDHFGTLENVLYADMADLCHMQGIGANAAALLTLVPKIMQRVQLQRAGKRPVLSTLEQATHYLRELFRGRKTEVFYVLMLDNQQRLLHVEKISEGSHSHANVETRAVVQSCLKSSAASVILAHNHPGGSLRPSMEDQRLTAELEKALSYIGVECVDHIIVSDDRSFSIKSLRSFQSAPDAPAPPLFRIADRQEAVNTHELAALLHSLDTTTLDVLLAEMAELERKQWGDCD